jgi:hypothetical protein
MEWGLLEQKLNTNNGHITKSCYDYLEKRGVLGLQNILIGKTKQVSTDYFNTLLILLYENKIELTIRDSTGETKYKDYINVNVWRNPEMLRIRKLQNTRVTQDTDKRQDKVERLNDTWGDEVLDGFSLWYVDTVLMRVEDW